MNKLGQWVSNHPWQTIFSIILLYFLLQVLGAIGIILLQPPRPEAEPLQNSRVPTCLLLV